MKIYFTASTTADGEYQKQYKRIISFLKKSYLLTSGEQIIKPKELLKDEKLGWDKVFEREKKRIEAADCVVAEVTRPSTGVGGEIVYALIKEKPVLALFYQEAEDKLSPMLVGNPSENLYLEHYNEDNLEIILRKFLGHVEAIKSRKGKLIVLDGGDGSGKTTQAKLLIAWLKEKGEKVKYLDFPRYYSSFHGKFVGRFLSGEFGSLNQVSPYLASLAYALDRASAREEMEEWLKIGGFIICNRYVTSNMAHQGARLAKNKRKEFLEWLDELEYRQHKMPSPDLVIYLYVPWQIGLRLTSKKAGLRKYVKGQDIMEKDVKHRRSAEEMYLWLAKNKRRWVKIDCLNEEGKLLPPQKIQQKIQLTFLDFLSNCGKL